jgi:ionotropic glutamate receptor
MRKNLSNPVPSFFFFLSFKFFFVAMGVAQDTTSIPVNVGVVLDLDDVLYGNIGLSCINMALSDFYASHSDYKTRLVLTTIDSKRDVVGAASAGSLCPLSISSAACSNSESLFNILDLWLTFLCNNLVMDIVYLLYLNEVINLPGCNLSLSVHRNPPKNPGFHKPRLVAFKSHLCRLCSLCVMIL